MFGANEKLPIEPVVSQSEGDIAPSGAAANGACHVESSLSALQHGRLPISNELSHALYGMTD